MSVAFFVPHLGCPHHCSFCDQRAISGAERPITPTEVTETLRAVLARRGGQSIEEEVAFFGGSFTAIDREYRLSLLKAALPYCGEDGFIGIRVSTRPDCIDREILRELRDYRVKVIELGAQSMDDDVLQKNRRGHTAGDVRDASALIREFGFSLILQMMTGLYGDSAEGARQTARELAALKPDGVRIYPTIPLRGTYLAQLYERGEYRPETLDEAVSLSAGLLRFFTERSIPVIRLGLHDSETLANRRVAGPYHPALRELCEGKRMAEDILSRARERGIPPGDLPVRLSARDRSKLTGHGGIALRPILEAGYRIQLIIDS